jgi:hypothetical protein|tara:strand:- start:19149 stop:19550 length:402 start_codon:yes stop_codon:yes gene_type:complete
MPDENAQVTSAFSSAASVFLQCVEGGVAVPGVKRRASMPFGHLKQGGGTRIGESGGFVDRYVGATEGIFLLLAVDGQGGGTEVWRSQMRHSGAPNDCIFSLVSFILINLSDLNRVLGRARENLVNFPSTLTPW